jgi:hypothetical protein
MAKSRNKNNGALQNGRDTTAATIDREVVAQRAYALYLERGAEDGRDVDDWLTAERELRQSAMPSDE